MKALDELYAMFPEKKAELDDWKVRWVAELDAQQVVTDALQLVAPRGAWLTELKRNLSRSLAEVVVEHTHLEAKHDSEKGITTYIVRLPVLLAAPET